MPRKTAPRKTTSTARSSGSSGAHTEKPPQSRRSNQIHDWDAIKRSFVEGWKTGDGEKDLHLPNMRELSEKFSVPYVRVREKSAKERWPDRRQEFQMQVTRERQKKRALKLAENSVEFDASAFNVAKLGMAMVTTRLAEIANAVQSSRAIREEALERQKNGEPVEKWELYSAVNYREMEGLATAAGKFQEVGMRALGTDVQRHEISGPDGGPIETSTVQIVQELNRDDPERLAMLIQAMQEANLLPEDQDIVEGELIEVSDSTEIALINQNTNQQEGE